MKRARQPGRHIGKVQARHLQRTSARHRALRARIAIERMPASSRRTVEEAMARANMIEAIQAERAAKAAPLRKLEGPA